MKKLVLNRNIIVSILAVMLLVYGSQGVSYGQGDAPTFKSGENNTSLIVRFQVTLDEGVDENAYQVQLRRENPSGEWITKCVVIERGEKRSAPYRSQGETGKPDIFVSSVWNSGGWFQSGWYSEKTFNIEVFFTGLEPGTTYETRYRDTNLSECTQNPPAPDPWSEIGEGITYNVITEPDGRTSLYFINDESIHQVTNDGTHRTNIVIGLSIPRGIAVDTAEGKIYWTDAGADKIQRANLDGSNVETVVEEGLDYPIDVAVDTAGGKIYWADLWTDKIQRANLDGTNIQDIVVTGLEAPGGIAVDIAGGKVYWTDRWTYKIQRANFDGTNIQDIVVTGLNSPRDIAADIAGGKIYWINWGRGKIQRANFDGTNVQDIVIGLAHPSGIALDVAGGKIYWTDEGTHKIQRANLDGTNIQDVVIGMTDLRGIALTTSTSGNEFSSTTPETSATTDAIVNISPASAASPAIGEHLELGLNITSGKAVAGYQATVQFDDTALRYVSAANGDFLPADVHFVEPTVKGNLVQLNAASLAAESNGDGTLATLTFEIVSAKAFPLTLSNVLLSNSAGETFVPKVENAQTTEPIQLKGDVNGDGTVNIADLVLVASNLDKTGQNAADVNGDGTVDIADLVSVAGALGNSAAAPSLHLQSLDRLTAADVKMWLSQAQQLTLTDTTSQRGILFLQQLLTALTPKETALLANYPNPFNPETWISYHLAKDADVTLHIYAVNGMLVRTLLLGHQPAGMYQNRSRAAYWDGKNKLGEKVASGVYFYTLTAGDFNATRKMLIRK